MMKNIICGLYVCLVFFAAQGSASAQNSVQPQKEDEKQGLDYTEKLVITKAYMPSIELGSKKTLEPKTYKDTNTSKKEENYDIISRPVSTMYPVESIKPAKLSAESTKKLYHQHIKLGFGTHLSPLAEAYAAMGRSEEYGFSASYKHRSAYGYVKDYDVFNTNNSFNEADIRGEIFADKFKVALDVTYNQNKVNTYGIQKSDYDRISSILIDNKDFYEVYREQPVRWFQNLGGRLSFADRHKNEDEFRYNANLGYKFNRSVWRSMENVIELDGSVAKRLMSKAKTVDRLDVGADIYFGDYIHKVHLDEKRFNAYKFVFEPNMLYEYGIWKLDFALKFNIYGEKTSKMLFVPKFRLNANLVKNVLNLFVGTDGDVRRNTLGYISAINPYLNQLQESNFSFTLDKFFTYLGMESSFSKNIDFKLITSAHFIDNYLSFDYRYYSYPSGLIGYSYVGYNDFLPTYTSKVFNFRLNGELDMHWWDRLFVELGAEYNYYNQTLLYTPAFRAELNFNYNIADKILISTGMKAYTNMKAHDRNGEEVLLKGTVDWSLELEYRFLRHWSVFMNLDNIISQRVYKWNDYPSYRCQALFGISFSI